MTDLPERGFTPALPARGGLATRLWMNPRVQSVLARMPVAGRIARAEGARLPDTVVDELVASATSLDDVGRPLFTATMFRLLRGDAEADGALQQILHAARALPGDAWSQRVNGGKTDGAVTVEDGKVIVDISGEHVEDYEAQMKIALLTRNPKLYSHQRIIDAIASGQPQAAAQAMSDHLTRANALYNNLTVGHGP